MASLALASSDEEFEREMLTAHAENTFIDNLSSLKTKNLFEASQRNRIGRVRLILSK